MSLNKRGVLGEYILMMYRLILLILAFVVVLGISSVSYSYDINVRDSEVRILAHNVVECLIEKDVLSFPDIKINEIRYNLLEYCDFSGDFSKYYISVSYLNDKKTINLESGDSGITYVRELVESNKGDFSIYQPGYYVDTFLINNKEVKIEVYRNAD